MRRLRIAAILLAITALAATVVYAALQVASPEPPAPLAAYAPPGALLALESPDFAALLHSWNSSAEQRRWLTGDDYAAFSRSRLFGRLGEAQGEFAAAAGLAPDSHFLEQIAGTESLFAWYDIGKLEFLYITRLPHDQAANMPLLALRDRFEQRQAGGVTFYVRTTGADSGAAARDGNSDDAHPRTVAFAVRGDLLLLATREDLMAGALEQIAHPDDRSLATDPWYAASVSAANEKPGDLRLTLDLAKVTRSPYFRSYWVQQNITAMRRYRAALSDLYRESGVFREERFLLPAQGIQSSADGDLTSVLHYLPPDVVYRAVVHPSAADALTELKDKVLARTAASLPSVHEAPTADLTVPIAGVASDLDDRIDAPMTPTDSHAAAFAGIASLLNSNAPIAMLSFSTADAPAAQAANSDASDRDGILRTIHTGVAFTSGDPCDAAAWQKALSAALSARVSVGDAGLGWREETNANVHWFALDGRFSLAFAAAGNTCLLASDAPTLQTMISGGASAVHTTSVSRIAGFSHAAQRGPLLQLARLLDHSGGQSGASVNGGNRPPFFSGNMASLSSTFENLDSETFTEFQASPTLTRQTVMYRLRPE